MEPENQRVLVPFLRRVMKEFSSNTKTLWVYTGCVLEELKNPDSRFHTEFTDEFLSMIDVLVDGPFIQELKDISLQFRGSSNQRILRLK
jgi:anaerobic ribonucleoside-triphosphate reductase activating protein